MTNFSGASLLLLVVLLGPSACASASSPAAQLSADRLWVLAPHPDDEVLMAGELLRSAIAAHRPVTVLVMTNGDLSCGRNGFVREAETIAALSVLGVEEHQVHFLGYPDGFLEALGEEPLVLARARPDGTCGTGSETYAFRGADGSDLHTELFGAAGPYVESGPVDDLTELLRRERPGEIVVTHPIDTHPDHAMTYAFLHRALERAQLPVTPTILRAIVHRGPCWPNGAGLEPCPDVRRSFGTRVPALAGPLDRYVPTLRIPSADGGLTKRRAIASYASQLGTPVSEESWLSSFARTEEVFWPERLVVDPHHPTRLVRPRAGSPIVVGAEVVLSSGGSAFLEIAGVRLAIDEVGARLLNEGAELRHMPWSHADRSTAHHDYELRIDPRPDDGDVAEVTVRRDGAFSFLAVIPWSHGVSPAHAAAIGAERAIVQLAE